VALRATRLASGSLDDRAAFKTGTARIERMSTDDRFSVEESARLLRAIYPNYPDILGMKGIPEVGVFLQALRTSGETSVTEPRMW
jgi:hypothetical protein